MSDKEVNQSGKLNLNVDNLAEGASVEVGDITLGDKISVRDGGTLNQVGGDQYNAMGDLYIGVQIDDIEDLPPEPGEAPYMGLTYFDEEDADRFFGRDEITSMLVNRLYDTSFLALIGASGSGKSSLVRAGVIPVLKRNKILKSNLQPPSGIWRALVMTPTARPLTRLAFTLTPHDHIEQSALRDQFLQNKNRLSETIKAQQESGHNTLLFIDQFEEIFTMCTDETVRQAFLDNILSLANGDSGAKVIVTLRADFYSDCLRYEGLRKILKTSQEPLGAMTPLEMAAAIVEPATQADWKFQDGLIEEIMEEVGNEPGSLPLLSHALLETWHRRRGRVITLSGYREAGKVQGAIAQTAESLYKSLDAASKKLAERIFLRLTDVGEGSQDTRRRVSIAELEDDTALLAIATRLTDARLLTTSQEGIDIAHEAIIREWPRLRQWLDDNREGLVVHRRLTYAARDWEENGRDNNLLYAGFRLTEAQEWATQNPDEPNKSEQAFLEASSAKLIRLKEEEEEQRRTAEALQSQQRVGRVLRWATGIVGGLMVIAIILAIVARGNATEATAQSEVAATQEAIAVAAQATSDVNAEIAVAAQATSDANAAVAQASAAEISQLKVAIQAGQFAEAAQAELDRDPELALLLAATGLGTQQQTSTENSFYASLLTRYRATLRGHSDLIYGAVFSPDGSQVLTASEDGRARLWSTKSGRLIDSIDGGISTYMASFSPNGDKVAMIGEPPQIWSLTGAPTVYLEGGHESFQVEWIRFNPTGDQVVTAGSDGTARLWSSSGEPLFLYDSPADRVILAEFHPDGQQLVTADSDGTARLWSTETGELLTSFVGHDHFVITAEFSADGLWLLTTSFDYTARIWTLDGTQQTILGEQDGVQRILSAAFHPTQSLVITGANDGRVQAWDLFGQERLSYQAHNAPITDISYNNSGDLIITASDDNTARVWSAEGAPLFTLPGHNDAVTVASFSPDGRTILTASKNDLTARLWATGGDEITTWQGHRGMVTSAQYSPDGTELITAGSDGVAKVWDTSGEQLYLVGGGTSAQSTTFTPDGEFIATLQDGLIVIQTSLGEQVAALEDDFYFIESFSYSPDGTHIVAITDGWTARVWTASGEPVGNLEGHTDAIYTAQFSPNSEYIVTASEDGTARIWTRSGEEVTQLL